MHNLANHYRCTNFWLRSTTEQTPALVKPPKNHLLMWRSFQTVHKGTTSSNDPRAYVRLRCVLRHAIEILNFYETCPAEVVSTSFLSGWPDWANFRLLGYCLLGAAF
jgi:hypothetical protein